MTAKELLVEINKIHDALLRIVATEPDQEIELIVTDQYLNQVDVSIDTIKLEGGALDITTERYIEVGGY